MGRYLEQFLLHQSRLAQMQDKAHGKQQHAQRDKGKMQMFNRRI